MSVLLQCLPGEFVCLEEVIGGGKLVLTNYRLIFIPTSAELSWTILLNVVAKVELVDLTCLKIISKLGLSLQCAFETESACVRWFERIAAYDRPLLNESSFCFTFRSALQSRIPNHPFLSKSTDLLCGIKDGGARLVPELVCREFRRMRFGPSWRITEANHSFRLCQSYPEYHIVPSAVSDSTMGKIAEFRSHNRFPSVVWRSPNTGAVLLRCAEPRVGLMSNRNEYDEKFMCSITKSCFEDPGLQSRKDPQRLLIVDARTFRMAQFKRLWGGGYEYSGYYDEAEVCFMDLPNLHAVRLSFERLTQLYAMDSDSSWFSSLERTCWLSYISQLLKSSYGIASALETAGRPVLVHCSDGWDRTAQLSSLAQLLADPYYRTIEGFCVLVEREWLHFGHKFADRCGQSATYLTGDERSPIFVQWLDCVHQVRHQFAKHFEFNDAFLVKLAVHSYSGLFGTFMCNSERERQEFSLETKTCSIWGLLSRRHNQSIVNHFYEPSEQRLLEVDWRLPCLLMWNTLYRGAFLPSYNVSIGTVILNKPLISPYSQDSAHSIRNENVDNLSCHDGGIEANEKFPSSASTDPDKPKLSTCDATSVDNGAAEVHFDIPCTTDGFSDEISKLPIACSWESASPALISDIDCAVVKHQGELNEISSQRVILSPVNSNVAILPFSSVAESPIHNNPLLAVSTIDGNVHHHSKSEQYNLPTCRRPSGTSSFLRNGSFSTDDGVGVFIADDEYDFPCKSKKHPADRLCYSDDEDRTHCSSESHLHCPNLKSDMVTTPITIGTKSGSMGSLTAACNRDRFLRANSRCQKLSGRQSAFINTDEFPWNSNIVDDEKLKHSRPIPGHVGLQEKESGIAGDEAQSSEVDDYTMHSLPEGELLLINEFASTGQCTQSQRSPTQSPGISPTDTLDGNNSGDNLSPVTLKVLNSLYFSTHYVSRPSKTAPNKMENLTVQSPSQLPAPIICAIPESNRPVSAPISPSQASEPDAMNAGKSFATGKLSLSTDASRLGSIHNVYVDQKFSEFSRPPPSSCIPYNSDWDGLPLILDPSAHCMHEQQLQEKVELKRQICELTSQLSALQERLQQLNVEPTPALSANGLQPVSVRDFKLSSTDSPLVASSSTVNGFPEVTNHRPNPSLCSPATCNRFSNASNISSFELVEHSHSAGWLQRSNLAEANNNASNQPCSTCSSMNDDTNLTTAASLCRPSSDSNMVDIPVCAKSSQRELRLGLKDAIEEIHIPPEQPQPLPSAQSISVSSATNSTFGTPARSDSSNGLRSSITNAGSGASSRCRSAGTTRSNATTPDGVAQA